jgi:HEAT repeat protein
VAFFALGARGDLESLDLLTESTRSDDPYVRRAALEAIGQHRLGSQEEAIVCRMLQDANEYVVRTACDVAAELRLGSAHALITALLKDPTIETRISALLALRSLWRPEDFALVESCFRCDTSAKVRYQAAWVLHAHADAQTAAQLCSLWRDDPLPRHRVWACDLVHRFRLADSGFLQKLICDKDGHVRLAARRAERTSRPDHR